MGKTNTNTTFDAMEYHVLAYLDDIKGRIADVRACEERIAEIRHQMGVRGTTYSGMPGPPNVYGDAIPDGLAMIEEQKSRYDDELAIHGAEIDHAWNLCRPHASENRHLLWLKYVQGMSWAKVARSIHVSNAAVYRMRTAGIEELYAAMPEEWRRDDAHKAVLRS